MSDTDLVAIVTTIDDEEKAREIARALVKQNAAACVQISKIDSVYEWQGEVVESAEFRLFAKTIRARYADAECIVLEMHSYDLPAVFAVDVVDASDDYADWVAERCRSASRHS